MTKEVLAVDARLCHGGCAILEEPDDIDPLGNDLGVDHKVDLGVNLVVGLSTVGVSLSELCSVPTQAIDPNLSVPGISRQVEDLTVTESLTLCLVVHWT